MKVWTHPAVYVSRYAERELDVLRPEGVRSVAVIKHAALGDLMLTRPFLRTVRKAFPNASITLGVSANYMNGVPYDLVDRVHVATGQWRPRPPWSERVSSYRKLGPHDFLFDLTASSASLWIAWLNEARLKIGFRFHPLSRLAYDVAVPRHVFQFEAETFLSQLAVLRVRYDWPLDFGYPARVAATTPPYLLYFPTASTPRKCWPAGRYGELLRRLALRLPHYEHRVLSGVAPWEIDIAREMLAPAQHLPNVKGIKDARGDEVRAEVGGAMLLIGNDTGVRNLAIALGTPTLGVFPVSLVYTYLPRFGHHDAVHEPDGSQPTVQAVEDAALRLLGRIGHAAPQAPAVDVAS